jgi:tight adherence protein C
MPEFSPSSSPSKTTATRPASNARGAVLQEDARRGETPFERVLRDAIERRARESSFYHRVFRPGMQRMADKSASLMKNADMDAIRFRLLRAGFPGGLRARDFVFVKFALLIALPLILVVDIPLLLLFTGWTLPWLTWPWILLLGLWMGWRIPDIWLTIATKKRQFEIQLALPDMIDLITISVEAGLGLYAAIQRVSMRFYNPLSEEFLRSLQEVRLGRTNIEAMRDMVRRVDVEDLTMFISSLIQAETLGVPIANVLRAQSERLRDKRRQRAREQAQKAPLKMLFPLVIFIFPALFVVILGPALLRVLDSGF